MQKKQKKATTTFLFLIFSTLIGISIFGFNSNFNLNNEYAQTPIELRTSASWSNFSSIYITDWTTVEDYDWVQGSGTWADPYIIENITMNAGGTGSGILIEGTSDYFIIRNCDITNWGNNFDDGGIELYNTNNGQVRDNDCSNGGGAGIYLYSAENNTLAGNIADNNDGGSQGAGIIIDQGSNNNTIYNNHCFNNRRDGIILYRSSLWNNVTYNYCSENGRVGVMLLTYANNNTIAYNNLTQNGVDQPTKAGIHVETCHWNYIMYNNVSNGKPSADGISLLQANYNQIIGNFANNNPGTGIYINGNPDPWTSSFNNISFNIANDNAYGIRLAGADCNNNTLINNTVNSNSQSGIYLSISNGNDLIHNIANANQYGIYLTNSDYNLIYENTYVGNTIADLYLSGDSYSNIVINTTIGEGPSFSALNETNDPVELGDSIIIEINVTDSDGVDTVFFEISGINYTMTNIIGDTWQYIRTPASLGVKNYNIWANDSNNIWNSMSDSFSVEDRTIPHLLGLNKNASLLESGEILNVQINATDLGGVDSVLFEILSQNHTMTKIDTDTWSVNWTSSSFGTLAFMIWVNDSSDNWNSTVDSVTVQDTIAPSLFGHSQSGNPIELGDTLTIEINSTDAGGISSVLFEIFGENHTMTIVEGDKWGYSWVSNETGAISYMIYANDTAGNLNWMSSSITVQDTTAPNLSGLTENADPIELGAIFIVNINITDLGGVDTALFEIFGVNYTMSYLSGITWQYSWVASSVGSTPYKIWANDSSNNWNWLLTTITFEDTTIPTLNDPYMNPDPVELGDNLTVRINATDLGGIDTVLFEVLGQNYTMTNISVDIWEYNWTASEIGSHSFTFWANDSNNNWAFLNSLITVQDTTGPDLFNIALSANSVRLGRNISIQVNITDLGGVNATLIEILGINYTMTNILGGIWEFNWTTNATGTIIFIIWVNDSNDNWNFTTGSFNVFTYSDSYTPPENTPESPFTLIIIIIIIIGSTVSIVGYSINTKKKKSSSTKIMRKSLKESATKKKLRLLGQSKTRQAPSVSPVAPKKKKKGAESKSKPLSSEEVAELKKTEKEVAVAKQKFTCIVHRGDIVGSVYICPSCQSFYCQRCAKVLKLKEEKCWTCGNAISVEVSETDKAKLLKKNALTIIEEIIAEKEFLTEFIEKNVDLDAIPQVKDYVFSVLTPDDINKIDLLELSVEEKKIFIKEYLALDPEERKSYMDEILQK